MSANEMGAVHAMMTAANKKFNNTNATAKAHE
jgi:hypothetical protein